MRSFLPIAAVALSVLAVEPSEAITLCAKRKGQVVARDACRPKEKPVDLAALGAVGPPGLQGTAGAPGAPGVHPLRLVDSAAPSSGTS